MTDSIGIVHMQSVGFATDSGSLWLAKKEIANDARVIFEHTKSERVPGGTVKLGGGEFSWTRTDGDECPDLPGYVYIVVQRRS